MRPFAVRPERRQRRRPGHSTPRRAAAAHPCEYSLSGERISYHEPVVEAGMSADMSNLIPAQDAAARRLEMLTLDEAHDLLRLLQLVAAEGLDELSEEAEWFAREIAARIPSER
ncbi:DUF6417 family protein [Streptomyces sp. NPDC102381]|uniref:DUF6417 family protein n=1 Tax=Streptomyces sp. NPDC102381 TaxID=3366164 RepID=UPI0037F5FE68